MARDGLNRSVDDIIIIVSPAVIVWSVFVRRVVAGWQLPVQEAVDRILAAGQSTRRMDARFETRALVALERLSAPREFVSALRKHRHLRSSRVLCKDDGQPISRQGAWSRVRYAAEKAEVPTGVHILHHTFCSHLVMRGRQCVRCRSWSAIRI